MMVFRLRDIRTWSIIICLESGGFCMAWNLPRCHRIYQELSFLKWKPRAGNELAYLVWCVNSVNWVKVFTVFQSFSRGIPCFIDLCFIVLHRCAFYKLKVKTLYLQKKWPVAELWYLLYCSGLKPNPHYLQSLPVNNLQGDLVQACSWHIYLLKKRHCSLQRMLLFYVTSTLGNNLPWFLFKDSMRANQGDKNMAHGWSQGDTTTQFHDGFEET